MNYKVKTLEKILNRKFPTIKIYLARAEFSHIKIEKNKDGKFVANVSKEDIEALKKLFISRKNGYYKNR